MRQITLTNLNDKDIAKVKAMLKNAGFKSVKIKVEDKNTSINPITRIAEISLAEEWNSEEDNRYDELYKK